MSNLTSYPCLARKGRHLYRIGACPHCELKRAKAEIERLEASRQKIFESADGEIERLRAELAASRERESRLRADLSMSCDLLDKATACAGIGPDAALIWWAEKGRLVNNYKVRPQMTP